MYQADNLDLAIVNKIMNKRILFILLLIITLGIAGYYLYTTQTARTVEMGGAIMTSDQDAVTNLTQSSEHNLFLDALESTGMIDTLRSNSSYTLFAPTDEAFAKLPDATLEAIVTNDELLIKTLSYHVIAGIYTSADLSDGMKLVTITGKELRVTKRDNKWYLNDTAEITTLDVPSSDSVIHSIDTVLLN